jgi:hypothetical protein
MDFTAEDNASVFPIRIAPDGETYPFCPSKALWDVSATELFQTLVLSAETGMPWVQGGIQDQPQWWLELAPWFILRYDQIKFYTRVRAIVGDQSGGNNNRPNTNSGGRKGQRSASIPRTTR